MCCALALSACALGAEPAVEVPPPVLDNPKDPGPMQTAVLAGGCFWGVQGVYQHVRGVRNVLSGYAGGDRATAQKPTVGSGRTGQAETVQIVLDTPQISYGELLQINI
jgi:peptide-methionine (S)-S-oxide reductase